MQYHCVYLGNTAVVRPATDGVREFEWFHGCRSIPPNGMREYELKHHIRSLKYHLLSTEDWNSFISSLDEPTVPSNFFVSTRKVRDKWDSQTTIY